MISIDRLLAGDQRTLAKAISLVEEDPLVGRSIIKQVYSHTGGAFVVGFTGPPGTGKSTLVGKLIRAYRQRGQAVGVLAIDPTSPFSGGALLGDRVRMMDNGEDPAVFIRSMASRGSVGGLSRAVADVVRLLDASGKAIILLETVGVGQADIEVASVAQAVIVVLMPELGDEIQSMKAGLMEIGDIFIVNKADLENADRAVLYLRMATVARNDWKPPVLKTVATKGEGIPDLVKKLDDFREHLSRSGVEHQLLRRRLESELLREVREVLLSNMTERVRANHEFQDLVGKVAAKQIDPHSAIEMFLTRVKKESLL